MTTENAIFPSSALVGGLIATPTNLALGEGLLEVLTGTEPLHHLIINSCPTEAPQSVLETSGPNRSTITINEDSDTEDLRGTKKSKSELLAVLPHQHFFESDGLLDLTFTLPPSASANSSGETRESSVSVKLVVDSAPGCGGIAWPAGQILSSHLTQTYQSVTQLSNKTIVELGSGTGLVGLIAGRLDPSCEVYITDQAPLLNIMTKNVELNALAGRVKVAKLNWGEPIPSNIPSKPDVILAADCVYFEPAFPLLVQTLADLADTNTCILFCYKKRRKADKRFFSLLKKKFIWAEVDDPNRRIYSREAINLLRLHKIPGRA
ncbi:hypothetical protein AN958_07975 [Leucoagaricus sp. SymC.cos]|nr:hypothetical protein AN958_07975 [Leucoagaricus sp. SymC.cos]